MITGRSSRFSWIALLACVAWGLPACAEVDFPAPPTQGNQPNLPDDPWANPSASPAQLAHRLVLDDTHVYWSTLGGRTVRRATRDGGPAETVVMGAASMVPDGLAVDATRVYYGSTFDATLESAPKDGGAGTMLLSDHAGGGMFAVAVDDTHVFAAVHTQSLIRRIPKDGGAAEDLSDAGHYATSITLDDAYVYWATSGIEVMPMSGGTIARVPKGGGETEILAADLDLRPFLAVDEAYVYWVSMDTCRVQRVPKAGGTPVTLAQSPEQGHCAAIGVDGTHVFWASALDTGAAPAGIWKAPKEGGAPIQTASQLGVYGLALDDVYVYFSSEDSFRRVPK
ncbi:MAG: hypothetical protein QM820_09155 [Minicystis sp.]